MIPVIIIAGSKSDEKFVSMIAEGLDGEVVIHFASAHREPDRVLEIIRTADKAIFITVAGRSNALSGMVAANTDSVVIACPAHKDLIEYMVDIHSTMRMPSKTPVLTILDPGNCALAVKRIKALMS